jgi:diguanylate cyclase (GGDEF)-like protein/PAS domain S-box-containing protein
LNQELCETLAENLFEGIYCVDRNRRITFWNKAAERISGYQKSESIGFLCSDNLLQHIDEHETPLCKNRCPLQQTLTDGLNREMNVYLHHKQGHHVMVRIKLFPIRNEQGQITGAAELFTDQLEHHKNQEIERLNRERQLDQLTGTGNRRFGEIILQTRLYELKTFHIPFGILFINIDHFKTINDTYGFELGNDVLKMVGKTLANLTRQTDSALRWGGDEFLLVLPNLSIFLLQEIAERIRVIVSQSFLIHLRQKISVTVSIGATVAQPGDTLESLIQKAGREMHHSKYLGRNKVSVNV